MMNRVKRKNVKENSLSNKPTMVTSNKCVPSTTTIQTQVDFTMFNESYLYFDSTIPKEFNEECKEKYIKALEYINHCHMMMNRLLRQKAKEIGDTKCKKLDNFKFPEICSFLPVFHMFLNTFDTNNNSDLISINEDSDIGNKIMNSSIQNACEFPSVKPRTKFSETNMTYIEENGTMLRNNKNCKHTVEKNSSVQKRLLSNHIKQSNNVQQAVKQTELNNYSVTPFKVVNNKEPHLINKSQQLSAQSTKLNKNSEINDDSPENLELPDIPLSTTQNKAPVPEFEKHGYNNYIENIIHEHIKQYINNNTPVYELNNVKSKDSMIIDNFAIPNALQEPNIDNYRNHSINSPVKVPKKIHKKVDVNEIVCTKSCSNIPQPSISNKSRKISRLNCSSSVQQINKNRKPHLKDEIFLGNNDLHDIDEGNISEESIICSDEDVEQNYDQNTSQDATENMSSWNENNDTSKSPDNTSYPFKLNEKDLNMINEKVLETIGLFTKNFEMRPEVVEYLQKVKYIPSTNEKNRQFRTIRTRSDNTEVENEHHDVDNSSESSDIRSESDIKSIQR